MVSLLLFYYTGDGQRCCPSPSSLDLFNNFFTLHHTLAKVVKLLGSKRKLIRYNDKSLILIYLLMLAVFSHKAQIATDLRAMKVGPAAVCHTRWSSVSCERPEVYPQCAWANQKKSCCALNSAQETDTPAFCNFQEYKTSRAFSIIVNCSQRHKIEVMHGMNANAWGALWQHCFWIYGCLHVLIYISF